MNLRRVFLGWVSILAACGGGGGGGGPSPTPPPPAPTSLDGIVYERTQTTRTPLAGIEVFVYFRTANTGQHISAGVTDPSGAFHVSNLPVGAQVLVYAWDNDRARPCPVTITNFTGNAFAELDLLSRSEPAEWIVDFALNSGDPIVTGIVYENGPWGRRPAADALIHLEPVPDLYPTRSWSDGQGRYALCHLPTGAGSIYPFKQGFEASPMLTWVNVQPGTVVQDLELVMVEPLDPPP